MATLHPSILDARNFGAGFYRERDVLHILEEGLPSGFDIFHNIDWSNTVNGLQQIGEVDIAIVTPAGHLLLVEVKSGEIEEGESGLYKRYASNTKEGKNIGFQVRRQHNAILSRLRQENLLDIQISSILVLPDYRISSATVTFDRKCIVDATEMDQLCQRIQRYPSLKITSVSSRNRLLDFLSNRFSVVPDVSSHIGQVQRSSKTLASGLATWVPLVHHQSDLYVIEATAGSGKTQLALALLRHASGINKRCAYVCYNRPLADHMVSIAPVSAEVMTFHEACVESFRRTGLEPDFNLPGIYQDLESKFLETTGKLEPRWDLLILDETQDFKPEWVQVLLSRLKDGGKCYLMGDPQQQIYDRHEFDLQDAVSMKCMDNFRSPRKVVDVINSLRLSREVVVPRSSYVGETPGFHTYVRGKVNAVNAVQECLKNVIASGVNPEHVVILSFSGRNNSDILEQEKLAGLTCRKPTGKYDVAGNALWTEGLLLTDTVYRFKGQSAPVVLFCEIDFDALGDKELCKLFVGMTRAQYRVECILSERAASLLLDRAG